MRIACICSTKNEGDIIEAFVRLNGRICNSFFFIDDSSDNTREIIALLVAEGYDLNYLPKSEGGHNQSKPTKAYLSYVKKRINPDWIFLLDADEIIVADDKEKLLQEMQNIPPNTYLTAEWKTYVPTTLSYFDSASPLSECFGLREDKGMIFKKASIPGLLSDNIITTTGNHSAKSLNGSTIIEQFAKSYHLAHFPVRSAEQIIVKNLIATHNLTTRVDGENGEGFHVFPIFRMIRNRNYNLDIQDLANIAIDYACGDQMPKSGILDELDQRNSFKLKTELKYLHLGKINVMARLDSEIEMLSRQISRMKKGSIVAGSMELVFPSLRELLGPNTELALAERDGQIANLNQTVAERDGQIASLNQAVAERDMQIAALYHSTSWRITWPLRIIGRQLKRFRREGLAGQLV